MWVIFYFNECLTAKKNVFRMILCTLRAINPTNYNRDSIIFTFRWFRKWKKISVYHRAQVKLTYSRKKCTRGNYAVKEAWRCPALWGQITLFIIENFTTKKMKILNNWLKKFRYTSVVAAILIIMLNSNRRKNQLHRKRERENNKKKV